MKRAAILLLLVFLATGLVASATEVGALTNVANLRLLSRLEANRGRPFELTVVVTMVDHNRKLVVVQDETGALTLRADVTLAVAPGQLISLRAQAAAPGLPGFPTYPFEPAESAILPNFEIPADTGNFHLTRLSGWVRPPVTGEYTFYIASDNSSELWLSTDANPFNLRKIAAVPAGFWANVREWTRYASQRSEAIFLTAGVPYYLEALSEQQEQAEHLAVAWQRPDQGQTIITGDFVSPGLTDGTNARSFGVQWEYWTNFALGTLAPITGDRRVESMVNARGISFVVLATNHWPEPKPLLLDQPLTPEDNYRWVSSRGLLDFISVEGDQAVLQIRAGPTRTRVRVRNWRGPVLRPSGSFDVEVAGVCEGARTTGGAILPGVLWAEGQHVRLIPVGETNVSRALVAAAPDSGGAGGGGLFLARGAVTFNGQAFGREYFVVEDAETGIFIVPPDPVWPGAGIRVGDWVEIGGNLLRSSFAPRLRPAVVNVFGPHTLPEPVLPDSGTPPRGLRDGQWTELPGVIRALNSNGSLTFRSKDRTLDLWVQNVSATSLEQWVDARVRLRGVVALEPDESRPRLLVPDGEFVELLAPPRRNQSVQLIETLAADLPSEFAHRVRVVGIVTYKDASSFYVQDHSGGIRVKPAGPMPFAVGDALEVAGFPQLENSLPTLADSVTRTTTEVPMIVPIRVDSSQNLASLPNQTLVEVKATLLAHETVAHNHILELQVGQRVLQAVLPLSGNALAPLRPGSVLGLIGVGVVEVLGRAPGPEEVIWGGASRGAVRILLRDAADITVLRQPPWWTLKKVALLIAVLVVLLVGVILRAQLLRRRFERQQAARLAFAQQLIEHQERERSRIAANLHDSLGQNLLAIKNQAHLALQTAADNSAMSQRLTAISTTVLGALEEVRQITHDLRPYQLDRLGLRQAIIGLVRQVSETTPLEFACNVDAIDGLFSGDGEINIYRIVQEAVTNVVKHAQATEAAVVLRRENSHLVISIRDNGRGRRSDERSVPDGSTGFGLSGMAERARIMGGNLEIISAPGQGFRLTLTIPFPTSGGDAPMIK